MKTQKSTITCQVLAELNNICSCLIFIKLYCYFIHKFYHIKHGESNISHRIYNSSTFLWSALCSLWAFKLKPSDPLLGPRRVNKAKLRKNGPQHMKATTITVAEIFAVLNSSLYWKNWYTLEALLDTLTLSLRAACKKYEKSSI